MELLLFGVVCIVLYFVSDRILEIIEVRRGRRLEHRTLVFFAIIAVLAVIAFQVVGRFLEP